MLLRYRSCIPYKHSKLFTSIGWKVIYSSSFSQTTLDNMGFVIHKIIHWLNITSKTLHLPTSNESNLPISTTRISRTKVFLDQHAYMIDVILKTTPNTIILIPSWTDRSCLRRFCFDSDEVESNQFDRQVNFLWSSLHPKNSSRRGNY